MENVQPLASDLLKRMWITRGARYNAYLRLKKKHEMSISAKAFLSSYVLVINSLRFVNFVELRPDQVSYIAFFTMVISVFILVLSLIDSSKDYKMNADKLYNSAIEIENLYNELKRVLGSAVSPAARDRAFDSISGSYGKILQVSQVNHDLIDYYLMFNNRKKENLYGNIVKNYIYARAYVLPFVLYHVLTYFTPFVFLFFLFRV